MNFRRVAGQGQDIALRSYQRFFDGIPRSSFAAKKAKPFSKFFKLSEEVKEALYTNKPAVALESTIYTHGFPYPDNVALALDLEAIVRREGGIPATIGVLDGVARVGLSQEELTTLASSAGKKDTMKVSRRDLPYILGLVSDFL